MFNNNRALMGLEFNQISNNRKVGNLEFNLPNVISNDFNSGNNPTIISREIETFPNGEKYMLITFSNGKKIRIPVRK